MSQFGYHLFGRQTAGEDRRAPTVRRFARTAAAGIMLAASFVLIRALDAFPEAGGGRPPIAVKTVVSGIGKRATVSLPDGSEVILGPGSTLSYPPAEFARRREVRLDGEAYFRIVPKPRRPFIVRLGELVADFGADEARRHSLFVRAGDSALDQRLSEFVIRAYPEEQDPRVAVRSGDVTFADRIIAAGWMSWLSNGETMIEPADTATWFSWTTGRITFTNAFREALPRLGRWYGIDLRVEGAIGDAVLAAALPDSLEDGVLEAIAVAMSAEIERHGGVVTFRRAASGPSLPKTR